MRVLIVGGGIVGLLTAVECAQLGWQVTVVEQGMLPNTAATSYDRHRVLRALHPGDPGATRAVATAQSRWLAMETLLAARFYHAVGALSMLAPEDVPLGLALLSSVGIPARAMESVHLTSRYPQIALPAGRIAILEEDAGVLLADRVLAAAVRWLRGSSEVRLCQERAATRVDAAARSVVMADGEVLWADRILVAAGPWSRALLAPLLDRALILHRQTMLYCRVPVAERDMWASMPAIPVLGTAEGAWLVPPVESTPLKLSAHQACRIVADMAGNDSNQEWVARLTAMFRVLINGFTAKWVTGARDCYYLSDTATGGPLLANLADRKVLAYAACGGGSFKYAPLIAEAVVELFSGEQLPPTGLQAIDQPREAGALFSRTARMDAPDSKYFLENSTCED